MTTRPPRVVRRAEVLLPDDGRVITRHMDFHHPPRIRSIVRRVMKVPDRQVAGLLRQVLRDFAPHHRDLEVELVEHCRLALRHVHPAPKLSRRRELLLGAYFTLEYSIESAALFNPSIVAHPDQSGMRSGEARVLISLRATGEGHVSSIVFRAGVLGRSGAITFEPPPRYAYSARPVPDKTFSKSLFCHKLREMGRCEGLVALVMDRLDETFTPVQLKAAVEHVRRAPRTPAPFRAIASELLWLTRANYELRFPPDCRPAEIVVFPATEYEQRGMEDLRLARFVEPDGQVRYYGTYTAYDGRSVYPMLLETGDFLNFHVSTLTGRLARNKGMALFPREVDGYYMMLSRHDGQNIHLLKSHNLHVWNRAVKLQAPREPWELVQIGNCGSPLETEAGWIVLTHGVGPMRQYCIGASLLDLHDPARVIGRLRRPLLVATGAEREGYVPNVVYSCGSMIHRGRLIIPYAMSDSRTAFADVSVSQLVARLRACGP